MSDLSTTTAATAAATSALLPVQSAPVAKDMSLEEKQRLAATINEMTMASLLGVAHILMKHLPEIKDQGGSELKIDLDSLDVEVLRELDAYCKGDPATKLHAPTSGPTSYAATYEPAPKKPKTERAPNSDKKEKGPSQKAHVLAGCERVLREHGQPLSAYELTFRGTDHGYFNLPDWQPDKVVIKYLQDDIKAGKKVFENAGGGKFGLTEFHIVDPAAKEAHIANRNQFLATLPPFSTPATPGERDLLRCKYVHMALLKVPRIDIFDKPVDAEKLGLHDYHSIITQPMDLGTIKKRFLEGHYKTFEDYKTDVMLVWFNAMKYNPPLDPVHQLAAAYQQETIAKMKEYGLPV